MKDNTKEVDYSVDENKERGNWSGKFDFILSCVGYAVGLGNVWRFPYLCYKNGGGAFLIPYVTMLAFAGLPLFFFELSLGQFSNLGPLAVWKVQPMFKGIGYSMIIISALVCIYYNVIIAWAFYYFFMSLRAEVPWKKCNNPWNYPGCTETFITLNNLTGESRPCNTRKNLTTNCTKYTTPAAQFWLRNVLSFVNEKGENREFGANLGNLHPYVTPCLLLAWIIVCACLIKGVKSSGKVVYFTAIFPYIVIIIMVIHGATLPGAIDGVIFYIVPKWEKLLTPSVWGDAAVQIFYSLGVAFGSLITMASFNRFRNNCYRDAIIVATINCFTSVFAGFAIFTVLGFMAKKTGMEIEDVSTSGSGLAFVAYAEGIAQMPVAPIWAVLFFIMILTLGMDSQFGMFEAVLTGLEDEFEFLRRSKWHTYGFKIIVCVIMFFIGLPIVSEGGMYYFTLLDNYSGGFSLIITCFFELVVISYIYGIKNFARDIYLMLDMMPNIYWIGCWMVTTPVLIIAIVVFSAITYANPSYNGITFPNSAVIIGWLICCCSIIAIPIYWIYYVIRFGWTITPDVTWGPGIDKFWKQDVRYQHKIQNRSYVTGEENNGYTNDNNVYLPNKPNVQDNYAYDGGSTNL